MEVYELIRKRVLNRFPQKNARLTAKTSLIKIGKTED